MCVCVRESEKQVEDDGKLYSKVNERERETVCVRERKRERECEREKIYGIVELKINAVLTKN